MSSEKYLADKDETTVQVFVAHTTPDVEEDSHEVFGHGEGQVDYRTTGWVKAAIFFVKMTFATGVLSIPYSLQTLGFGVGCFFIAFWSALNTYMAIVLGDFKLRHRSVHTVAEMGEVIAGPIGREVVGFFYIVVWVLCSGISILTVSIALNALSDHGACTVVFTFVAYIIVCAIASVRKISELAWLSWIGFGCILSGIMIVVIGVAVVDRPAAAPQTGPYTLILNKGPDASATFTTAIAASLAIYASSANTSGYIPVISEMKRPQDYPKAVYACMIWIFCAYISMPVVVYKFCGQYVASPSLGSANPLLTKIAYGIAFPGLVMSAVICAHLAGKYLFVRILRNSRHLTANTSIHWITWLGSVFGLGAAAFVLASAIPFFGSLVSLIGALGFGPLGIMLPAVCWLHMYPETRTGSLKSKLAWGLHAFFVLMGAFCTIAGTYANIVNIIDQYKAGTVGSAFSCADNS
ncbi:hypothetical protein P7C73_g531, partial [Tremellales sp. Uapishka_1]